MKIDFLRGADRDAALEVGLESRVRDLEVVIGRENIGEDERSVCRRAEFARTCFVISFVNWTLAPTTRAPAESTTVPVIEPVTVCRLPPASRRAAETG